MYKPWSIRAPLLQQYCSLLHGKYGTPMRHPCCPSLVYDHDTAVVLWLWSRRCPVSCVTNSSESDSDSTVTLCSGILLRAAGATRHGRPPMRPSCSSTWTCACSCSSTARPRTDCISTATWLSSRRRVPSRCVNLGPRRTERSRTYGNTEAASSAIYSASGVCAFMVF